MQQKIARHHYIIGNAKNTNIILEKNKTPPPQIIISSPPYFDLLNYNDNKRQVGYGQKSYEAYLQEVFQVFQDCYDLSKPNATFWLIVDTFKKNGDLKLFPFDIVSKFKQLKKKSWILKDIIIWDKGKNLPWNNHGNFKNQHEYILFFTKGDNFKFKIDAIREILELKKWWKTYPERYNPRGKAPSNIWSFPSPLRGWGDGKQNHLCPLPFPLIEKIISLCTDENDWILDPFAGSGSCLAIAKEMGRNSIGIDVNAKYKKLFNKEVLIGAARYWEKRKLELENGKAVATDFKRTNSMLRKLKVAANVCIHLNKVNGHSLIFYAKNKPNNNFEVMVLQNGVLPKINLEDEDLLDLIKQAKVNPTVTVKKDHDFIQNVFGKKIYRYKFKNFFSYYSTCKIENVLNNPGRFEFMYSDIAIKVSNN